MEPISTRDFLSEELRAAQALAIERATLHTEEVLRQYATRPDTYGGRYVCADTMKELLPGYAQSPDSRNALNGAVHNSAAVLSAEQFRRVVDRGPTAELNQAFFVTGIPGAGKSTAVSTVGAQDAAVYFEGQLSRPEPAFDKIERALKAGLEVNIIAVHVQPELALERTNTRFMDPHNGRGASIAVMSEIQGNLPDGLKKIQQKFGDAVQLTVLDNTPKQEHTIAGWHGGIAYLEKAGHRDEISQRLHTALDAGYREGRYSAEFYRQAAGRSPSAELGGARGSRDDQGIHPNAHRSGVPTGNPKENALTPYAQGRKSGPGAGMGQAARTLGAKPATPQASASASGSTEKRGRGR